MYSGPTSTIPLLHPVPNHTIIKTSEEWRNASFAE